MGRIVAWTPSLTGGIVVVRDPCLHGRFSIGSLCVGPSDTMSWSPTIGLLITPQEPIQPRLGGRVERFPNTFRTEVVSNKLKTNYYLRSISTEEWLAYPPKLTVELGSYVDGEAHGWAR